MTAGGGMPQIAATLEVVDASSKLSILCCRLA